MSVERKAIRAAMRDQLLGATRAGNSVDTNRAVPHRKSQLPALSIYTRSEQAEKFEHHGSHMRTVRVAVELFTQEPNGVLIDDELDDFCEEVESRILWKPTLELDFVQDTTLTQVEVGIDDQGERLNGAVRITFDVRYLWDVRPAPDPYQPVELKRTHTGFDLNNSPASEEAADDVELPGP